METNPMISAGIRAAVASSQRSLDILNLLNAPTRIDKQEQALYRQFNFAAAVADLCVEKRSGIHKEIHDHLSRHQHTQHSNSILVPLEAFRADTVAGAIAAAGFLVETQTLPVLAYMGANTVVGPLGATVIPLPGEHSGFFNLPKVNGSETAYWLAGETGASAEITESDIVYGLTSFAPHSVGVYSEISQQLNIQAPQVQAAINRDQAAVLGRAIDLVALQGSGIGPVPTGISNTAGIATFSAAALTLP